MVTDTPLRRLDTTEDLEDILLESRRRPVWLLKHSLVCPLSASGKREFERFVEDSDGTATFAIIEVQRARGVSDELARRLDVRHETPQAVLIVAGRAEWHGSHWSLTSRALEAASDKATARLASE